MRALAAMCLVVGVGFVAADDSPKPISPSEAIKKVDQTVTVRMEVKSGRLVANGCYLNSESDFKSDKNLTLYIDKKTRDKFKEAKIDDPAAHFKGKMVEVKGKVTLYRERPQIKLSGPGAIKLVETKEEKKNEKKDDEKK